MSKNKRKSFAGVAVVAGMALAAGAANAITIDGPEGVGDLVWVDTNVNGIRDVGETGLAGVTVNLLSGVDQSLLDTTATDALGNYGFSWDISIVGTPYYQLTEFIVEFVLPVGYVFTPKDIGADDTMDSDANTVTGRTDKFFIYGPDEVNFDVDAGMILDAEIPLPAAVWLFGTGLLGLVGVARRKKSM